MWQCIFLLQHKMLWSIYPEAYHAARRRRHSRPAHPGAPAGRRAPDQRRTGEGGAPLAVALPRARARAGGRRHHRPLRHPARPVAARAHGERLHLGEAREADRGRARDLRDRDEIGRAHV